jgi:O-6-methylguanine DNA methyltransferase
MRYHGVLPLKDATHPLLGAQRINSRFVRRGKPTWVMHLGSMSLPDTKTPDLRTQLPGSVLYTGDEMNTQHEDSVSERIGYSIGNSILDRVLVAQSAVGVCAILLGDNDDALTTELRTAFPAARIEPDPNVAPLVERVVGLIDKPGKPIDLALDIRGSAFERLVWKALEEIEPGTTASYGEIARKVGDPRLSREVAEACASNPLAVAIPCHRVIKKDGALSGYRWGFKRKRALLKREAELYSGDRLI